MRSGPATRTAWSTKCLAAYLTAALSSSGARFLTSPHSAEPEFQRTIADLPIHSHRFSASSSVPPLQAETLRRPQRPGKPARVTAFLETLQQFTLGNH